MPDFPPDYSGAMQEYADEARPSDENEDMALTSCTVCGYEWRRHQHTESSVCDDCMWERQAELADERMQAAELHEDEDDLPW